MLELDALDRRAASFFESHVQPTLARINRPMFRAPRKRTRRGGSSIKDRRGGTGGDAFAYLCVENVPKMDGRNRRSGTLKFRIRGDQRRTLGLRASQIEAIVDRVVYRDGDCVSHEIPR